MTQLLNSLIDKDYSNTLTRFDAEGVAERYAKKKNEHGWRNRRELALIDRSLAELPHGSGILDLPCGTGRVSFHLARKGYLITAADASPNMVRVAGDIARQQGMEGIDISVRDIFHTGFTDNAFDAVICNRLLHHYRSPEMRIAVLRELKRISRGRIVSFYFLRTAASLLTFDLKYRLKDRIPEDRIPITLNEVKDEAHTAGLKVKNILWVKPFLSPQAYVVMEP